MKKTNHNRYIVIFFLCFLSLAVDARQLTLLNLPANCTEEINDLSDMLRSVFKLKKRKRIQTALEVKLEKCSQPRLERKNNRMFLTLVQESDPLENPANIQALLSGLLLSSGALDLNENAWRAMPEWLCAGIRERQLSFKHSERFLRGLRNIPAAEIMWERLPALAELPTLSVKHLPPESRIWYRQFSRLLLETAIQQKMLPAFGLRLLRTQSYEKEHSQFFSKLSSVLFMQDAKKQRSAAERVLWNGYHPKPAEYKLKQWAALQKWQIPALDKKTGEPTDKNISFPLAELHNHLKDRPDAAEQRTAAAGAIDKIHTGCIKRENAHLYKIYLLLKNPAGSAPEERTAQLIKAAEEMKKMFQQRAALEKYLYTMEYLHSSVSKTYKHTLKLSPGNGTASPEQIRFLLETEKVYGD